MMCRCSSIMFSQKAYLILKWWSLEEKIKFKNNWRCFIFLIKLRHSGQTFFPSCYHNFKFLTYHKFKHKKENNYLSVSCKHPLLLTAPLLFSWKMLISQGHSLQEKGQTIGWIGCASATSTFLVQEVWTWASLWISHFRAPDEGRALSDRKFEAFITLVMVTWAGSGPEFASRFFCVQGVNSLCLSFCIFKKGLTTPPWEWWRLGWDNSSWGPRAGPAPVQLRRCCCSCRSKCFYNRLRLCIREVKIPWKQGLGDF